METMTLTCPEPWEWTRERWTRERWSRERWNNDDDYTHQKRVKICVIHAKADIPTQDLDFLLQKRAFEAIPSSMLDQYEGQFVVSHNGQILDHDFDLPTLTNRFFSNYPDANVYISNVGNDSPEVFSTPLGL